jgi:hypothetical protein
MMPGPARVGAHAVTDRPGTLVLMAVLRWSGRSDVPARI